MFPQPGHRRVLGVVLLALCSGIASARPLEHDSLPARAVGPVARQQTTITTAAAPSNASGSASQALTESPSHTRTEHRPTTASSSTIPTTSRSALAAPTKTSVAPSSRTHTSRTSTSPATSPTLASSTSTSASATATSSPQSNGIFAADNPYRSYAIAVTVVVSIFGFLLLVLLLRFLVRWFKKPQLEPITSNLGAGSWQYSRDSNPYSPAQPSSASPTQATTPDVRHKDISDAEMSERHAFLSTDSVTLYPVGKPDNEPTRYNDGEPEYANRMRSFSASSSSGSQTAVPFVSRRPTSMSFLHSPTATHPAFIVHPGSDASHSDEAQSSNLRAVPEEGAVAPNTTANLLLARANHSDPYRQQTLAPSTTDLSRAASTASAYSQQSAYSFVPPIPVLPAQYARPSRTQLSPDVSAALSSMQKSRNGSIDSLRTFKTTAPPTEEGTAAPSVIPQGRLERAAWAARAQSSMHAPDLYFGHS
ncbi:hypothetical protein FRC06_009155 [Ceratobasidium sp. 370]|nr:hypothetical protein FRC06_009155 [Ceratobasidium sp. 370]